MTTGQQLRILGFIEGFIQGYLQDCLRIAKELSADDFNKIDSRTFFYDPLHEIYKFTGKDPRGGNILIKELAAEAAKLSDCSPEQIIINVAQRAAIAACRKEEKNTLYEIASNLLSLGINREDIEDSTGLTKDELAQLAS